MKQFISFFCLLMLTAAGMTAQTAEPMATYAYQSRVENRKPEQVHHVALDLNARPKAASFPGLASYLQSHLTYPEWAQENGIEGTVTLEVYISREGLVTDVRIVRALGFGCDEAAREVIAGMPAWIPASNHGVSVKSKARLDIDFHLR